MRRMSIWPILVELIICLTVLCGCHAEGSVSTPSPDSSRSPYLSELYLLKYDPAFTICDVTVNRVFDYIYDGGYQGDEFLVVDCTVEHIFFRAPSTCGNDEWVEPNSTVFLWIDIAGLDESVIESLRSLSEDVDSMIVYGREIVPTVFKDSPECMMFVEEVGENNIGYTQNIEGEDVLAHEYFHAVQNAYFKQNGWFKEAAAVWFAAKYSGSITRAKGQFEKYLSSPETTMQDTKYGNGVFPMAIDVAYGGSATIRKIYERLNSVGSKDMSETQLENAITWAIQQYDSSGSFAEAFKKLGAYITLPDHFFASVIPSNASWSNGHINRYTPTTTEKSISVTLESFGLKPFELRPNSSTSPQDLEVVIDFSGVRSTTNSVRFVKETASGSIIPFGTDATAVRYSAVINPFGNATSAANNIVDLYVAPINAGSYDRRINITYQLAG